MVSRRLAVLAGASLLAMLSSCAPRAHYHLRVNAASPAASRLCVRGEEEQESESCEPLRGQRLRAPGQLTVTVEDATVGAEYALQVEEQLPASASANPEQVVAEVLSRLGGFARTTTESLSRGAPNTTDEAGEAVRRQVLQLANDVGDELGNVIEARVAEVLGPPAEPPPIRAMDQVDEDEAVADVLAESPPSLDDIEPGIMRAGAYGASDFADLRHAGATEEQMARAIVLQCRPGNWGNVPEANEPLRDYLQQAAPTRADVLAALGLDAQTALQIVRGDPSAPPIDARIESLLRRRKVSGERSPEVLTIERLFVMNQVHVFATRCAHNLEVARNGGILMTSFGEELRASLEATANELAWILERTRGAADIYVGYVAPLMTVAAATHLQARADQTTLELGTMSLHAGRISLGLTERRDERERTIANTEMEVVNETWLAVSVGPIVSMCEDCFLTVAEVDRAATSPGGQVMPARRVIAESATSVTFNMAIAVHASPLILNDHRLGFMLGYPLTEIGGSSASVLLGLGWGFAPVGLFVSAGAHLFVRRGVRDGSEVDLSIQGNENLRVADVTEEEPAVAAFLMVSLSSDLVFSLARL